MCIIWNRGEDTYFFPFRYSTVPVLLLKNLSFSYWFLFVPLQKKKSQLSWPFNIELFPDYSCSICLSIFLPIAYCFDYYMFIVTTQIRQCKPSRLVFFFFPVFFSLLFCYYLLASAANLFGIALTVYQFRKNLWYWVFQSVNM